MVIFGATGDLTHKKLIPALCKLFCDGQISDNIFIVGVGRRELTTDDFRAEMAGAAKVALGKTFDTTRWENFGNGLYYEQGYFEDPVLYDLLFPFLPVLTRR